MISKSTFCFYFILGSLLLISNPAFTDTQTGPSSGEARAMDWQKLKIFP